MAFTMSAIASLEPYLKSIQLKRSGIALALWGEAGIGKTHQIRQLLYESSCRNFSFQATSPLETILLGLPRSKKLPLWTETVFKDLDKGSYLESYQTLEILSTVLASLVPVILHLEDIHELRREALELLKTLAESIRHSKNYLRSV
jgi:type II secretory pathway predicted ATPase ExeA